MSNILVINAAGQETRVALIEQGTISEYYLERKNEKGIVGNIYKGKVVRVLPGMQAAFVDIGLDKAAFLYVGDIVSDPNFPPFADEMDEKAGSVEGDPHDHEDLPEPSEESEAAKVAEDAAKAAADAALSPTAQTGDAPPAPLPPEVKALERAATDGWTAATQPLDGTPAATPIQAEAPVLLTTPSGEPAAIPTPSETAAQAADEVVDLAAEEALDEDGEDDEDAEGEDGDEDEEEDDGDAAHTAAEAQLAAEAAAAPGAAPTSDGAAAAPADGSAAAAPGAAPAAGAPAAGAAANGPEQGQRGAPGANSNRERRGRRRGGRGRRRGGEGKDGKPGDRPEGERKEGGKERERKGGFEGKKHGGGHGGHGNGGHAVSKRAQIQDLLKEGDEVLVQVVKDPIGTKGARITCHISLPGRHMVFMPTVDHVGISRRIESDKERRRLRELVDKHRPNGTGFIVRTVAENEASEKLTVDIKFLLGVWNEIGKKLDKVRAPALVHPDLDLVLRSIRDLFSADVQKVVIDDGSEYERVLGFVEQVAPEMKSQVELYTGAEPIFDEYGIEHELIRAQNRKVWLKSGGYIIIDQTEALVAIDVNSGRYTGKKSLEETITKINCEAAKEIVYQLRLRNIGGIIILDFIDMDKGQNREKVFKTLQEALEKDRAKTNVLKISDIGLVEMTRKRVRESMGRLLNVGCPTCDGRGYVKSAATVAYEIMREAQRAARKHREDQIVVNCHPDVARLLQATEREALRLLMMRINRSIQVRPQPQYHVDQYDLHGKWSRPELAQQGRNGPPVRRDGDQQPRGERQERPERNERGGRGDRGGRGRDRGGRDDKQSERADRGEKGDRGDKSEKSDKADKPEQAGTPPAAEAAEAKV
ncbi:MAG: Rne/Rng family ribonuclease [Deltaproteobacteria bacterium]|nr:Rne/Rng family ribonuclease [Deltaproteobacteria bacterium]